MKSTARTKQGLNLPSEGRPRAVIDRVLPTVDGGRFAAKCVAGEPFEVEAHAFTDGHDQLRVMLAWRALGQREVQEVEMRHTGNDEWHASFTPPDVGLYDYAVIAWVDHFKSWRQELVRRVDPADIRLAAVMGAILIEEAAARVKTGKNTTGVADRKALKEWAARLRKLAPTNLDTATAATAGQEEAQAQALKTLALSEDLAALMECYPDRSLAVQSDVLPLMADRERARFGAWYEFFPRSSAREPGRHGSFADAEEWLPYVAEMGFDVVYFPPIHPIGRIKRKGPNNSLVAGPDDVGSPWAIGAEEGGHKSILPELGTPEDFRRLVERANQLGLEIAMDIAFQCAPDHPYVKEHPQWFNWRPDGTVQYAENPPKKYQDIYPFNFETEDWPALWAELRSVFEHWIGEGVKIFRVDNPHTKSFAFWTWCIADVKQAHPEVLFLSEAFTRPKVMHRLAKLGFSQSYTYFTWRRNKDELTEYFTELSQGPGRDYFRPNVWPNTPDILTEQLHGGGRAIFVLRLLLASTLSSNYGIYGPAYELQENRPRDHGGEEYLDSEKYQLRTWNLDSPQSLRHFIARLNRIRRENRALQDIRGLRWLNIDNGQLIAYARHEQGQTDSGNLLLCVVNLDTQYSQSGWLELDLAALGLPADADYTVDDLLSDQRYVWRGSRNFIILDPARTPGHVFRVQRADS